MQDPILPDSTPAALFHALGEHLELWPLLNESITNVAVRDPRIQLYPRRGGTHLSVFRDWVLTLPEVPGDGDPHLVVSGRLRDGTKVDVVSTPDRDEGGRLLTAGGAAAVGDAFSVEVLHQVLNGEQVQAVAS